MDYTLITAEGAVSAVQSEDCYLYIEAGLEGWVLYPLDNATYRYDDGNSEEDGNTKEVLDPGRLLAIELQTYNDTAGAVWYLDDMALTSQSDDVIDALEVAPAKTDDAPEGVDMYFGQGFGKTEVGDGRDGLSAVAAIQGESDASNIQYLVTDNTLNQGNALSMTFNGDAGNFITTNFTEIGLHFSDEDRAAMASADSLVLRVKTPADTKYAHFDMMLMLEESVLTDSGRDRGGVGGVFMNRGDFSVNPGSVTLVDAATNQYVVNEFNDPYFMPNGFDGWVILPLSYFKLHPAYAGSDNNGELDVDELVRLKFQVENAPCGETFVLDSIGVAKATDFLASLNASEKPVDQTVVLQPGQTDPVSSNILQYVKDNEVNLTVVYEDGYPLYTWKFAGKDITSTDAFDAVLVNECDEVNAVKAMYKPFTGYFFKTAALPGKAALSIYLGDDYMAPSLYRYADGKCEKVGALTVDSEGYATLELAEGGVYFLTEATLEAVEGTTPAQPDTDPSTKPDPNPSTGYVFPMAVLLLTLVSAAAALLLRKKAVR